MGARQMDQDLDTQYSSKDRRQPFQMWIQVYSRRKKNTGNVSAQMWALLKLDKGSHLSWNVFSSLRNCVNNLGFKFGVAFHRMTRTDFHPLEVNNEGSWNTARRNLKTQGIDTESILENCVTLQYTKLYNICQNWNNPLINLIQVFKSTKQKMHRWLQIIKKKKKSACAQLLQNISHYRK